MALIRRSLKEGQQLVVNGVHIVPGLVEPAEDLPLFTYVNNYAFSKQLEMKTFPDELPRFYFAKWK